MESVRDSADRQAVKLQTPHRPAIRAAHEMPLIACLQLPLESTQAPDRRVETMNTLRRCEMVVVRVSAKLNGSPSSSAEDGYASTSSRTM